MPRLFLGAAAVLLAAPTLAQEVTVTVTTAQDTVVVADSSAAPVRDRAAAQVIYNEGLRMTRAGDHAGALAKYDEALAIDDTYPAAAYGRGVALGQLSRYEDARVALERAVALAQGDDQRQVREAAQTALGQVQAAIAQVAANAAAVAANEAAAATAARQTALVEEIPAILNANEVSPEQAQQAFTLMEELRGTGYDMTTFAFYYAKALNLLNRGAEAVPYAESALAQADPATDRSGVYVELGKAQLAAGNREGARAAFEAARTGGWASWAEYYLRTMDESAGG